MGRLVPEVKVWFILSYTILGERQFFLKVFWLNHQYKRWAAILKNIWFLRYKRPVSYDPESLFQWQTSDHRASDSVALATNKLKLKITLRKPDNLQLKFMFTLWISVERVFSHDSAWFAIIIFYKDTDSNFKKKIFVWICVRFRFKLCLCTGKSFTCFENGGDSADLILDRNDLRWRCGRLKSSWTWKGFPEQMKNFFFMKYSWISNCVWQFRCFCLFVDSQNGNKMIW